MTSGALKRRMKAACARTGRAMVKAQALFLMAALAFFIMAGSGASATDEAPPAFATSAPAAVMDEPAAPSAENPYGLRSLWQQGDLIARVTLLILAIMSAGSWYILFVKLAEQRALLAEARKAMKRLAQSANMTETLQGLPEGGAFRAVAQAGIAAAEQHARGLTAEVSLIDWTGSALGRAVDSVQAELQRGLAFLATVGSTAPFVGLFGTVWGIYHALIAIGIAGQASIDKVAGPVGEALIMTAIGLAVAVPAVLAYNWLIRRNKAALDELRRFAAEIQTRILIGH